MTEIKLSEAEIKMIELKREEERIEKAKIEIESQIKYQKDVEYYNQNAGRVSIKDATAKFGVEEADLMKALGQTIGGLFESKEVKEPSKEVLDNFFSVI